MRTVHIARTWILTFALATVSCGSVVRDGTGTSFLIVNELEAARGGQSLGTFGNTLLSDVLTVVDDIPTTYNDVGRVRFSLGLKDQGPGSPTSPSQNQAITVDRYRVRYVRADGRDVPGVDVPYGFDGAFTTTVGGSGGDATFTIVRNLAKSEAPLKALASNGLIISTIAEVTFYGRDQTGRETSATARVSIDFGNFGDSR